MIWIIAAILVVIVWKLVARDPAPRGWDKPPPGTPKEWIQDAWDEADDD